jgi:DNA-binding IclR family transcriptional regulator
LLRAAVDYVEIGGRRRVIELAKRWGIERTQARDLLNACTQKGYLTRGRPGVASRGLTDHALQILAERSKK